MRKLRLEFNEGDADHDKFERDEMAYDAEQELKFAERKISEVLYKIPNPLFENPNPKSQRMSKKITVLRQLMRMRNLTPTTLGVLIKKSPLTTSKYLRKPKRMTGDMRAKLASSLQIPIEIMDDICNRKITQVNQVFNTKTPLVDNSKAI